MSIEVKTEIRNYGNEGAGITVTEVPAGCESITCSTYHGPPAQTPRLVLQTEPECSGRRGVSIDLIDVIDWVKTHRPDLLA